MTGSDFKEDGLPEEPSGSPGRQGLYTVAR